MSRLYPTAIYIRLSREDGDKDESDSVSNQKKLLMTFVQSHEELLLYNIYTDDGYSGTTFRRPAFRQMLSDIEERKVTCVLVKDLSRFGRDYIESGRFLERYFPEKGVRFISVSDHIDSLRQSYDMLLPIRNVFNEQYARDISRKVHSALRAKQQCGEFIGAFASYGYRKSPGNKNRLLIDEYAASVVRRIFSLYLKGCGKQQIARILNAEGVLSPSEYKRAAGLSYGSPATAGHHTLWSYSTINHILHKEIYVGNMVQGTKRQELRGKQRAVRRENWVVVPGTHPPIIDEETWNLTQALLKSRVRSPADNTGKTFLPGKPGVSSREPSSPGRPDISARNPGAPASPPTENPFSGLLFCAGCGRPMVKTSWRHADGRPEYAFTCGTCKRYGRSACTPHTISARALTQVILSDLSRILSHCENLPGLARLQAKRFLARWSDSAAHGAVPESSRAGGDARQLKLENILPRQEEARQLKLEDVLPGQEDARQPDREEFRQLKLEDILPRQEDTRQPGREEFLPEREDIRQLEREEFHLQSLLRSSYEDYKAGLLSRQEFLSCQTDFRRRKKLCADRLRVLREQNEALAARIGRSPFLREAAGAAAQGAGPAADCTDSATPGTGLAAECADSATPGAGLVAECADSAAPGTGLAAECADAATPGTEPAADCADAFSSGAAQAIFPDRGLLRQLISRIIVHENRKIQIIYLFPPDDTFSLPGQYSIKN